MNRLHKQLLVAAKRQSDLLDWTKNQILLKGLSDAAALKASRAFTGLPVQRSLFLQ